MLPVLKDKSAAAKSTFARALDRFAARRRGTRIGFVTDATASREATWEAAQWVQGKMFFAVRKHGAFSLRLIHFGGNELTSFGWFDSPRAIAKHMAGVRCASGYTQFLPALAAFASEAPETIADAIILIGDCFEEDTGAAETLAHALKAVGIRVFAFLEGDDSTAEDVFRRLAEITGGRFARLGDDFVLHSLCQGVALLMAGGTQALAKLPDERAKRLLLGGPPGK